MVAQGLVEEGEAVIKAVRNRYDGENRNPWNEIECGSNYARSMASFALLPIYSGFSFDMEEKRIGFAPLWKGDGQYLWSVGNSWGSVRFEGNKRTLSVYGKAFTLSAFRLQDKEKAVSVTVDEKEIPFKQKGNLLVFENIDVATALELALR